LESQLHFWSPAGGEVGALASAPKSQLERHERLERCFGLLVFEADANPKEPNVLAATCIGFPEQRAEDFFRRGGVQAFLRRPGEVGKLDLDESLPDAALRSFLRQVNQKVGDEQV
jgi:hypothetical protein